MTDYAEFNPRRAQIIDSYMRGTVASIEMSSVASKIATIVHCAERARAEHAQAGDSAKAFEDLLTFAEAVRPDLDTDP